jgi:hypothetical protein
MAITQQDVENYGSELIDFSRRAALEALGPEVRALQQQNQHLQARLRQQTRQDLERQLDVQAPGWRRTYDDPAWRAWLDAPDDFSGQSRRELINRAAEQGDVHRVAAFFQHPPAAQHGQVRSRQSRASAAGNKPLYTREQIKQLYAQRARGGIPDARWAQIEADMIAAASEGRINSVFDKYGNETRFR